MSAASSGLRCSPVRRTLALIAPLVVTLLLATATSLTALPRFSLLTGTRCSACHFNPQGSGLRTDLGWSTMNRVGLFDPDSIGLGFLSPGETNSFWDGLMTLGFDVRMQVAKLGRPPNDRRRFIPMQVAPSIALAPFEGLTIYGTYNAGPTRYPGQTSFDAAVQYQPDVTLPTLKVGYIQPSIGLRHDDHTNFIRRDAALGRVIIPPNYNELGGELDYEGLNWATINVGAFSGHNLALADISVDATSPSLTGRIVLLPQLLDEGINGMAGGSILLNGDFRMINAFAGFGLADKASIYGEGMYRTNGDGQITRNLMIQGSYELAQWLSVNWRYEWALSENVFTGPFYADAFVIGTEFFLLPGLEIRPEYRYFKSDSYMLAQYTLQLHAFY